MYYVYNIYTIHTYFILNSLSLLCLYVSIKTNVEKKNNVDLITVTVKTTVFTKLLLFVYCLFLGIYSATWKFKVVEVPVGILIRLQ